MKGCTLSLAVFFTMISSCIGAEIQEVVIHWNKDKCSEACATKIDHDLRKLNSVSDVVVDHATGQATIKWKPTQPFRYYDFHYPFKSSGVDVLDVFITVRGLISHAGKRFTLKSIGDHTSFFLFSPLEGTQIRPDIENRPESYSVSADARDALLQAEAKTRLVTIAGKMINPQRSPPNYLIMHTMYPDTGIPNKQPSAPEVRPPRSVGATKTNK